MKNTNDKGDKINDKDSKIGKDGKNTVEMPIVLDNIHLDEMNKGEFDDPLNIGEIQNKQAINRPLINNPNQKNEPASGRNTSCTLDIDKGYKVNEDHFVGLDNENLDTEEKLIQVKNLVINMHPMQKLPNGELTHFPVCKTNTRHIKCCTGKNLISDLSSLGLGIVGYFHTLKAMAVLFLFLTLINIPLIIIYFSNHPEKQIITYQDALFKTTIGNIGAFLYNCQAIDWSKSNTSKKIFPLDLYCSTYNLSSILSFGPSSSDKVSETNKENCQNFSSMMKLKTSPECDFNSTITKLAKGCFGKTECHIEVDFSTLEKENSCIKESDTFYLSYTCHDEWVKAIGYNITRSSYPFLAVGIDLLGMIFFLIVLITTSCSHRLSKKYFRENLIQISDYTLRFEELDLKTKNLDQEIGDFVEFLQKILNHENKAKKMIILDNEPEHLIYDVAYPIVTDYKLDLVNDANKLHRRNEISEENLEQMRSKIKASLTEEPVVNELFVTFTRQNYKNHLKKVYSIGKCDRCCLIFCCQKEKIKHLYYKNKWLKVNQIAEQPSNIIWENMTYSSNKRCCRKVFSIIIAIIILCLPFGLAIGSNYLSSELSKNFNSNLDCSKLGEPTKEEVLIEMRTSNITKRNQVKTYCFCYHKSLISFSTVDEVMIEGEYPCKEWKILYAQALASSVGIICVVPIFNVIFSILLDLVTVCERNKTISNYYKTLMIRTFVLQLLNTAIILIIVNMLIVSVKSWVEYFPFFTGQFQDMDPDWYSTVGTSIIFCMILNIVTPHCSPVIFCLWNKLRACCDKGSDKETKCKIRKEYLSIYLGPEFNISARYASILTTISVILIFSSGMPILYLCSFIFMFLTYWIDKFLLLKYYQLPPKTDLYLDSFMNVTLYITMLIHLGFGVWTYGNEKILSQTALSFFTVIEEHLQELLKSGGGISDNYYRMAFNRILFSHNIIVIIFMILLVFIMIWRFFFWKVCKKKGAEKIKTAGIYESMKLECLYSIYNTRRALYRKAKKSNCVYLKNEFFNWRINYEKKVMINMVKELFKAREEMHNAMGANDTLNNLQRNFNKEMPVVMNYVKESDIKRKESKKSKTDIQKTLSEIRRDAIKKIGRDYTYHIIENPKYHDFAYYYIFAKDKMKEDILIEKNV